MEEDNHWYKKYQVLGTPANVSVPTHFFKCILGIKHEGSESVISLGGFVLPNEEITETVSLREFVVPIEG